MLINELYDKANSFISLITASKPALAAENGASVCIAVTDTYEIISAVTGCALSGDTIAPVSAERLVLAEMALQNKTKITQLIIMSIGDRNIAVPDDDVLDQLISLDVDNGNCQIAVANDQSMPAKSIKNAFVPLSVPETSFETPISEDAAPAEETTQEDAPKSVSLGAPAEFSEGFDFD